MDVKDLQYGDWILVNGTVNFVGYDLLHQMTLKDNANWEIKGIPLTAEFLEANGFEDINKGILSFASYLRSVVHPFGNYYGRNMQNITVYCWRENNSDVYVERPYGLDDFQIKITCADIVYVHELQHLLNMCGLKKISYGFRCGNKKIDYRFDKRVKLGQSQNSI